MRSLSHLQLFLILAVVLTPAASVWAESPGPNRCTVAHDPNAASADTVWWVTDAVDTADDFGSHAAVAIDPRGGIPFVSYYDATDGDLRLASPVAPGAGNCGPRDAWWCRTVDSADDVGRYNSIDIWHSGSAWKLGISYYNASTASLEFAEYTDATASWTFTTIDAGGASLRKGVSSSMRYDSAGVAHVSYFREVLVSDDSLMYAQHVGGSGNCGGGSWDCFAIETGEGVGSYTSLDVNAADEPRIAYYNPNPGEDGSLKYAQYVDVGGNCGPDSTWLCDTIDAVAGTAGFESSGPHLSLHVDESVMGETADIAYYKALSDTLALASYAPVMLGNCGPGDSWRCSEIDAVGSGAGPMGVSLDGDSAGIVIAYHDPDAGGALKVAQPIGRLGLASGNCGPLNHFPPYNHTWQCDTVDDGVRVTETHTVGQYAALALRGDGLANVAYYDATAGDLVVAAQITEAVVFTGTVSYAPAMGPSRPQGGVPVTVYGVSSGPGIQSKAIAEPLDSALSQTDGHFELVCGADQGYDAYRVAKGDPRGLVPRTAAVPPGGAVLDPGTVAFDGTASGVLGGIGFTVGDALIDPPSYHSRYLIVTTGHVANSGALDDFIDYKSFLGFEMIVKTVEELDPGQIGGNYLREQIRNSERALWQSEGGLEYVLLIGTHETVPFMTVNTGIPDYSRTPAHTVWHGGACNGFSIEPNNCGWGGDWYYVDLSSDWDTNNDGIYGELIWADPVQVQGWINSGTLPANYVPDEPPAFQPDVAVGRLMSNQPNSVKNALASSMAFEKDGGDWKRNTLLAGALFSIEGEGWFPPNNLITATYQLLGPTTDSGYLMERVWEDILQPAGHTRIRLYEKACPYADCPPQAVSGFDVDAPVSEEELVNQWSSQNYGLVKLAGHGSPGGVIRIFWEREYISDTIVENPTAPLAQFGHQSRWETTDRFSVLTQGPSFYSLTMPNGQAPVLMAMACSTGHWTKWNIATRLLTEGRIAAWIGGVSDLEYQPGWQYPNNCCGQSIDYLITDALIRRGLSLGDAVWTGLGDSFDLFDGPSWDYRDWSWGFLSWDLFGDPSMSYWGNGPETRAPWPMFHRDWPGTGETSVLGPQGPLVEGTSIGMIAATPPGLNSASPVVGRGRVVIGDGNGDVHNFAGGAELWSFHTGGPIVNAAALSADGTAYVKSSDGQLYAISADGSLRWSRAVGESEASPKIAGDGTVYVGGSDSGGPGGSARHYVAAYRPNGTRVGRGLVDGRVTTAPSLAVDGTVWVGTAAGTLYKMSPDLATATAYPLTPGAALGSGLALADDGEGTVLVPSTNGSLLAWSSVHETVRWTFTAGDAIHAAPALGANGQVFVGSRDGKVYALRLSDGSTVWESDTGAPVDAAPALDSLNVYAVGGDPAEVYALARYDGATRWSVPIGGTSQGGSSPALGNSRTIYVASSAGQVLSLGNTDWAPAPAIEAVDPRPEKVLVLLSLPDPAYGIQLERREPGGDWNPLTSLAPGVFEYEDYSVAPEQSYEYRAMAVVGAPRAQASEPSDYSAIVSVRALPAVPTSPGAPNVAPVSATELHLTWTAAPSNVAALEIQRRGPGEVDFQPIGGVSGAVTEFTDQDLEPASPYTYRLRASNEAGNSAPGGTGSGSTLPRTLPAPGQVVVKAINNTTFRVCWTPAAGDLDAVVARRPWGLAALEPMGTVAAGKTCLTDDSAYRSRFEYWVKHIDPAGTDESEWTRSGLVQAPDYGWGHYRIFLPLVMAGAGSP